MNVEAVAETQGFAGGEVGFDFVFKYDGLNFIWDGDDDKGCLLGKICGGKRLESIFNGEFVVIGAREFGNNDFDAAVAEILTVGVALGTITDDTDGFIFQEAQVRVIFVINSYCHVHTLL